MSFNKVLELRQKIKDLTNNNTYLLTRIQRLEKLIVTYSNRIDIFKQKKFDLEHGVVFIIIIII